MLNLPTEDQVEFTKCVQICQHRSCRKQGAVAVLAAFQALPVEDVKIMASGCLGQCGNGPMVLVLPEMVWYSHVLPLEVQILVEKHLLGGQIVTKMLYHRFHAQK
ncbi:MAG: (2Fe-2S) ferredoxin domain-containing protein [Nostocales cyanobacterium]|nr:MAG: (2Fe-2S) ferredoxin domain-containing protein [Nostocales cyanobacterium]TAF08698.1 MAG: (2Fe-2S) ferredoxin domain-containing protein [Nostocales cyanobacterium]